jgi:restriction system protein
MWYYRDVEHVDLGKFKRIRGNDEYVVQRKADEQLREWDKQWRRFQENERARNRRLSVTLDRDQKKTLAIRQTEDLQAEINELRQILAQTANLEEASWDSLYDHSEFDEPPRQKPVAERYPPEPKVSDPEFLPKHSFFSIIFPRLKRSRIKQAQDLWEAAHFDWEARTREIEERNDGLLVDHARDVEKWVEQKGIFEAAQNKCNQRIDALRERHLNKDPDAVVEFTDLTLSRSEYPSCFPKGFEIGFDGQTGVMVVDYELPDVERFPKLAAVKYVQSRDTFENVQLKQREFDEVYESAIYQICLRTVIEIFTSDFIDAIKSVTFNGYVDFIARTNGKSARACIVSLQTTKVAIDDIDFKAVDPKSCFRALKGVGSSKLSGMAAVAPILKMSRMDRRFVPARDVIDTLSQAVNIAAIPWEDFEHLVRDVFEKEFASAGGEVKITRASRDHGVDAIAFDPDPIRGGKIVIQAKRYTNPVGVSAVRDLYGTLINEGASRGILVTTSVYGPDSYDFAKGKPITLLSGGNLLHLLEKHGHPARIDLREAKAILAGES